MAKDLTALSIEKCKPGPSRIEMPDGKIRGLYLIIQPTGHRSWAYRYRNSVGKTCKVTFGSYPGTSLEAARKLATKATVAVADGRSPSEERVLEKAAAKNPRDHELVETVVQRFLDRHARPKTRPATFKETERILHKEIVGRWEGKPLSAIKRSDVHAMLDEIVDRGSPISANRSLGAIRPLFRWAVERDIISVSPCEGVRPPAATKQRDRVLDTSELHLIWKSAENLGYPFGYIIQLLMILGQRRDEVAGMNWSELDFENGIWTLPPGRVKNAKGHTVPLSAIAVKILSGIPRIGDAGFVFTTNGVTHVSGFTKAKQRIDEAMLANRWAPNPWVLHDLRRTMATGCAALGIAPQVVEAILNHRSGTIRGIAAVYNRYNFASEKKAALDMWSDHLSTANSAVVCKARMAVDSVPRAI